MKRTSRQQLPFKIFGLQRTGTNLMAALLTRNFHAESLEKWTRWKHGTAEKPLVRWNGTCVRYIICVKNPYAWLASCFRYFCKARGRDPTLPSQFERHPSMSFDEFITSPSYEFTNPIERWNRMNEHWLGSLPSRHRAVVRHEDILVDQIPILKQIDRTLNFSRRTIGLRRIHRRVDVVPGDLPVERRYYLQREYMLEYSPSTLERINSQLNRALMARFSYVIEQLA
jgi:hypothetical protein